MKKILLLIISTLIISCVDGPDTPVLTKNEVSFDKEGGKETIYSSGLVSFVYDKDLGYKESNKHSSEGLESQTLDCGWVIFEAIFIYGTGYHYDDPKITITVKPNTTGSNRSLSIKFNGRLNGKESRTTTLTVHQKGD